ncbi:unnamed protein product [Calicophoron daubneyi]
MHNLGIKEGWEFVDVYSLDPEMLGVIPRPVLAVLLLFPITDASKANPLGQLVVNKDIMFIKQTIANACGTVALLHSIVNNQDSLEFKDRSLIDELLEKLRDLQPEERGLAMENEERLSVLHEQSATEGQTTAPDATSKTNLHFVCFVERNGNLYELDGRNNSPICHGTTSRKTLLEDSCAVIQKFMSRDPDSLNFTVVALCKQA